MKKLPLILMLLSTLLITNSCEKGGFGNKVIEPEFEWVTGGTTMTYTYRMGVVTGYNFIRKINVLDEGGEITISIRVDGQNDTEISEKFVVEAHTQYEVKVKGGKVGHELASGGGACLTVVFESPNCSDSYEIPVYAYTVFNSITGDMDYCATSISFSDLTLQY